VFALATVLTTAVLLGHWQVGFLPVTLALSAYALGAFAAVRAVAAGAVLFTGCVALLFAASAPYFDSPLGLQAFAQVGAAGLLGAAVSRRHTDAVGAADRAARLARESAREAERVVLAERLRVARELNVAVSDAMTAITVQAAAARRAEDVSGASDALATIERIGRAANEDLRRLLRTLRRAGSHPGGPTAPTAPAAGAAGWSGAGRPDVSPVDVALGGCVALFNVLGSALASPSTAAGYGDPVPLALVPLLAAPGAALVVRRRYPVAALVVTLVTLGLVGGLGWQTGSLPGSVLIASFALGAWAPTSRGLAALGLMGVTMVTVELSQALPPGLRDDGSLAVGLVAFTLPWVVGVVMRHHRRADEARVEAAAVADREHAAAVEQALTEERLAVARDLHDLVSHGLTAITVQAAAARRRDEPGGEALEVIARTGRSALTDLRRMLAELRQPGGGPGAPAPGLAELEELVARHRAVHGPVALVIDPALEQEPGSMQTTAFRLVQESLTNVARHAPGARTAVTLSASDRGLRMEVVNRPAASAATTPGTGWGLTGMRERVALVGGSLDATSTADGGFAVRAELDRRTDR
jgi:signal transduction histidine kinase